MIKRDYRDYIYDIINSINSIEKFIENMDYETFKNDDKTTSAVIRKIEIIGEASRNIPMFIRKKYNKTPWNKMIALRNIAIHEYFGVDLTIIWDIIKKNLTEIKPLIEKIVDDLKK